MDGWVYLAGNFCYRFCINAYNREEKIDNIVLHPPHHPSPIYYLGSSDAAYGEADGTVVVTDAGWVDNGAIEAQAVCVVGRFGST